MPEEPAFEVYRLRNSESGNKPEATQKFFCLITKPTEILTFAVRCLALDNHPEFQTEIREKLSSGEVTDDLIWLCTNHLVIPVLYLKFKEHGLLDIFPDEYAEQLQEIYELNRNRKLKIMQQIDEISASLFTTGGRIIRNCTMLISGSSIFSV